MNYQRDLTKWQEMEQERIAHENEERERTERMERIKEQFDDPESQWEKDKSDIQNIAMQEKAKEQVAAEDTARVAANYAQDNSNSMQDTVG